MKKFLGSTLGGLQKKAITLVLMMLMIVVAVAAGVSAYQNKTLVSIVEETRSDQQQAISKISERTMDRVLESAMVSSTEMRAKLADNDFSEIVNDLYMLQTMAPGILENRSGLVPIQPSLPDPELDGTVSAMVLFEAGVDYRKSEYLGLINHMATPMIAMLRNSEKIEGCFVGLCDGTDLCVDDKSASKYDENGRLIPFPVRERPWYVGAVETDGL